MTSKLLLIFFLLVSWTCTSVVATAATTQKGEAFGRFYSDFQNAVKGDNKEKVADLTNFDTFTWEGSESLQKVKTKEAFLKYYGSMFTPTMKSRIATSKPVKINDDSYFISWHTKTQEYSMHFSRQGKGGSFKFEGLAVGPY
jgi:hypothetical protein